MPTRLGWCATCDRTVLKPGTPGYCGTNAINNTAEGTIYTDSKNWGFCDFQCALTAG